MANELQQVIKETTKQVNGYLEDKRKTGEFLPERAIPRDIEQDIQGFIERSDKAGCILIGPPGMGKTYVVCRILQRYRDTEYPVLAYGRGQTLPGRLRIWQTAWPISSRAISDSMRTFHYLTNWFSSIRS